MRANYLIIEDFDEFSQELEIVITYHVMIVPTTTMMYQSIKIQEYYLYNKKCKLLLQESEVRFAGFLDSMGNLIAGGYKKGVIPLHDESQRRTLYIDAVLRMRTQQDYDDELGQMEYSVSRRRKVIVFTFAIDETILFISTEPTINIESTAQKIMSICKI